MFFISLSNRNDTFFAVKPRTNLQIIYYSKAYDVLVAHNFQILLKFIKIKLFSTKIRIVEPSSSHIENM